MSAPSALRLPPLTVAQASVLLDVLDALTNAVVLTYGEQIFELERGPSDDDDDDG